MRGSMYMKVTLNVSNLLLKAADAERGAGVPAAHNCILELQQHVHLSMLASSARFDRLLANLACVHGRKLGTAARSGPGFWWRPRSCCRDCLAGLIAGF